MNTQESPSIQPSQHLMAQQVQQPRALRVSELREQRLQVLLDSCQQEVLQQIIGPFGLTPAMFDDKQGGNVTTLHNFEQGIVATENDQVKYADYEKKKNESLNRKNYDLDLKNKRDKLKKDHENPIISAYTGAELPRDGRMHLDHVVSVNQYEKSAGANLFQSSERRVEVLNSSGNLVPAESSINQSMGDKDKVVWAEQQRKKDPGKTNAESFGIDEDLLRKTDAAAKEHVKREQRKDQFKKQKAELLETGVSEAKNQALRRAMGVLLHEFANHSFIEVKRLAVMPLEKENFLDELTHSLKNVAVRVLDKLKDALEAAVSGGIQGFVSNLLTFVINNFITTSAKVVTLIRESMHSLWRAIKTIVNPPPNTTGMQIAREAIKIIASAVTVGLGMMMEESVKGFIMTIPVLIPVAETLSAGVTGILTGLSTALVVYGLDRLFDALENKGTEELAATISHAENQASTIDVLYSLLQQQVATSKLYDVAVVEYQRTEREMSEIHFNSSMAAIDADKTQKSYQEVASMLQQQIDLRVWLRQEFEAIFPSEVEQITLMG